MHQILAVLKFVVALVLVVLIAIVLDVIDRRKEYDR